MDQKKQKKVNKKVLTIQLIIVVIGIVVGTLLFTPLGKEIQSITHIDRIGKQELSYDKFLKEIDVQQITNQEYVQVKHIGNEKNKTVYELTDKDNTKFKIKSDKKYDVKQIYATIYELLIKHPSIKDKYSIKLCDTSLGKSYTDEEFEKFNKLDYQKEIKEYYNLHFYE